MAMDRPENASPDRDEDDAPGLNLPIPEVDESEYRRALDQQLEQERLGGSVADEEDELLPGGETGISRVDAPGQ